MEEIRNEPVEHSASKEIAGGDSKQEYEYVKPYLLRTETIVEPRNNEPLPRPNDDTVQ